jgi:hypothetical protein
LGKSWAKDFSVTIAGRGAGGRRKADNRFASVGGIVIGYGLAIDELKSFLLKMDCDLAVLTQD